MFLGDFTRWGDTAHVHGVIQFGCSVQDDAFSLHHSALQQRELLLLQLLRQLALAVSLVRGTKTHQQAAAGRLAAAGLVPSGVPAAAAGRAGCPAPCCSSASPAPQSCGAAEPAVSGSSARPPAPSPSAAAPPSPPADPRVCCSAGCRSVERRNGLTMLFFPRGVGPWYSLYLPLLCSAGCCWPDSGPLEPSPALLSACRSPASALH